MALETWIPQTLMTMSSQNLISLPSMSEGDTGIKQLNHRRAQRKTDLFGYERKILFNGFKKKEGKS